MICVYQYCDWGTYFVPCVILLMIFFLLNIPSFHSVVYIPSANRDEKSNICMFVGTSLSLPQIHWLIYVKWGINVTAGWTTNFWYLKPNKHSLKDWLYRCLFWVPSFTNLHAHFHYNWSVPPDPKWKKLVYICHSSTWPEGCG